MLRAELVVAERTYNVLFLCTHSSARSVMGRGDNQLGDRARAGTRVLVASRRGYAAGPNDVAPHRLGPS